LLRHRSSPSAAPPLSFADPTACASSTSSIAGDGGSGASVCCCSCATSTAAVSSYHDDSLGAEPLCTRGHGSHRQHVSSRVPRATHTTECNNRNNNHARCVAVRLGKVRASSHAGAASHNSRLCSRR
jgi:hypothetical protein